MLAVFLLAVGVVLGAGIAGAYFASKRPFVLRIAGALAALSVLVAVATMFWKHIVLTVAITSLVALSVGVMLQRADPLKAMLGALCAFVLLFIFSSLAVELADVFLFGNGSELLDGITEAIADSFRIIRDAWGSLFSDLASLGAIDGVWISIEAFLLDLHPTLRFVLVFLAIVAFLRILMSIDTGSSNRGERK